MSQEVNESIATATASALHRFNRYEIKYYLPETKIPEFREQVRERMAHDSHNDELSSRVSSLYFDSADFRFYWEKIEGLRFRRKLRIRAYGDPEQIKEDSTVFVEIKQRVNRVTQKRRIALSYREAKLLCEQRMDPDNPALRQAFVNEVLMLCNSVDLQPTVVTTYQREAYVGIDADQGMRITMDHRVQGRNKDLALDVRGENRFIIPPHISIVEIKANERVPTWFTDLAARLGLDVVRVSKYCKAVEASATNTDKLPNSNDIPEPPSITLHR
ncbi:MAG: vacuolar transporter [Gammaproteobacteria bacterium]|nr:vacuolar transporter [Gammaproteobacteria bacterium]MAY02763.1 vacuolar transporter [Gammaproteobacteria bacterium]|tara:strand:- start:123 stop:941 length:819 start_codon:yes stop_codon:yes gene_type:complete